MNHNPVPKDAQVVPLRPSSIEPVQPNSGREVHVTVNHHYPQAIATPREKTRRFPKIPVPLAFFGATWIPVIFGVQAHTLLAMGVVTAILLVFSAQK